MILWVVIKPPTYSTLVSNISPKSQRRQPTPSNNRKGDDEHSRDPIFGQNVYPPSEEKLNYERNNGLRHRFCMSMIMPGLIIQMDLTDVAGAA